MGEGSTNERRLSETSKGKSCFAICFLFLRLGLGLGLVLLEKRNASTHSRSLLASMVLTKKDGPDKTTFSWNHSLSSLLLKMV